MSNRSRQSKLVRSIATATFLFCVALSARALEPRSMTLPSELASAERLPVAGFGGWNRGRFHLPGYRGQFKRIESRFAVLDPLYAAKRGKASFTLEGSDIAGAIRAECGFVQIATGVDGLTFAARKLAYVCDIVGDEGQATGRLTLVERKPADTKATRLAPALRIGRMDLSDLSIDIASVHEYARSKLASQAPLGYLLWHGAQVIGAIEIGGIDPTIFLIGELPSELRRAALAAALGVAVLRDPTHVPLDD